MADLVLGCDLVVTGNKKVISASYPRRAAPRLVVNTAEIMPGDFTRNADYLAAGRTPEADDRGKTAGRHELSPARACRSSTRPPPRVALLGNAIAANMFMLGYAWQTGRVPLTGDAIRRAIELNGEADRA